MTPEIEARIKAREWAIDPPLGSPLRKDGYATTKLEGIGCQIIIPRYVVGGVEIWPRTKVKGDTYELARDEARRVLLALELKHRSGVSLDPKHLGTATAAKSRLIAAGHDSLEAYEMATEMGVRAFLAQAKFREKYNKTKKYICTKDIVSVGEEELERLTLTVAEGVADLLRKIDPPDTSPTIEGNDQEQGIRAHLEDMAEYVGEDTPFIEVMRDDERLRRWVVERLGNPKSDWSLSNRRRAMQDFRRLCRHICPPRCFPMPSHEVLCRRPEGEPDPIIAIPPAIVERVLQRIRKEKPKRLMYVVLQAGFGLRPDEAWKLLQELRDYLHEDYLVVPAHISKTRVQRIIRIRPFARAWLEKALAAWADKRVVNFLEQKYRGKRGPFNLQNSLRTYIKSCGWKKKIPKECLRKCWITACVVMGVPVEERLLQEAGHESSKMLTEHYLDPTWKRHMGRAYFSIFPDGKPDMDFSDYELCHAFDQPEPKQQQTQKE